MEIETVTGFDWDDGNRLKNQDKHGVSTEEAESVFFNRPLLVLPDVRHSAAEPRSYGLGRTDDGRGFFLSLSPFAAADFALSPPGICTARNGRFIMTKSRKPVPEFASEADERAFWESHDSSEYLDWSQVRETSFPHLGPSTKAISLRLPKVLLTRIRAQAKRMDVPYQSLIKIWLYEKAADPERPPE